MELQTLLQTVSTERDELHLVIRNFESTSEQHVSVPWAGNVGRVRDDQFRSRPSLSRQHGASS